MRTSVLIMVAALNVSPLRAQDVRGVVVEDDTRSPISGVTVQLVAKDSTVLASAITAENGWFRLRAEADGRHYLRASHPLYATSSDLAVTTSRKEIVTVVIRMGRAAIPLEPLVVTARSRDRLSDFRARAAGRGLGRYILRAEIERKRPIRTTDLLKQEPNLVLRGGGNDTLLMRSFGESCTPAVYVDGLLVPSGFSIDDLATVEELEGVEIYRSGAITPMELHVARNTCGAVAIWTRPARGRPLTLKRVGIGALVAGAMFFVLR